MTNTKARKNRGQYWRGCWNGQPGTGIHENGLRWQEDNSIEDIRRILKRLSRYQVERLVMEATGCYEFELAQAAYNKGLPVCIAKPVSVRHYAGGCRPTGQNRQNRCRHHRRICRCGKIARNPENLMSINNLLARCRQLVNLHTQEINRLKIMDKTFEVSCRCMIPALDTEIECMEKRLSTLP